MGYIDASGNYHKEAIDPYKLRNNQQSTFKQSEQHQQRKDHARDIIQPFRNGEPNEQFIEAFPEESKEVYNFTKTDEELLHGQN